MFLLLIQAITFLGLLWGLYVYLFIRTSRFHSFSSSLKAVMIGSIMKYIVAPLARRRLERDVLNPVKVQQETLASIQSVLDENIRVVPGVSPPLTTYVDYREDIEQIAAGTKSGLSSVKVESLGTTSGTSSGGIKMLPSVKGNKWTVFSQGVAVVFSVLGEHFGLNAQKTCKIMFEPNWRYSKGGLRVGPNSSSPSNSKSVMSLYVSPLVYELPLDLHDEQLYLHALTSLYDRNLVALESNFASLIDAFRTALLSNWDSLVHDISTGEISITIPDANLKRIQAYLPGADPQRAQELREAMAGGEVGLAKRLWPHMQYVLTCDTGSFKLYGDRLKNSFLKGVVIFSPMYAATEGLMGVALDMHDKRYIPTLRSMYFEWLSISENDTPTDIDKLKVGSLYEIVITTYSGLVRYRMGDVVKCVGYYKATPVFEFSHRKGTVIDLRGEKTTESQVFQAMQAWAGDNLVDYTLVHHTTLDDDTARYHVFVELVDQADVRPVAALDQQLQSGSAGYGYHRSKSESLAELVVHLVPRGTFSRITAHLRQTRPPNQLKIARLITDPQIVAILEGKE